MSRKRIILLGSTGSIGQSACKVARMHPERMQIVGLAAHSSGEELLRQANEFEPKAIALADKKAAAKTRNSVPTSCKFFEGIDGLAQMVEELEADMVLVAIVGTSGLLPALKALHTGKDLAVASKEILVMAGEIVTQLAKAKNRMLLPVDSEHNAIFQCLQGARREEVKRLILTASGGPFRTKSGADLHHVKIEEALKHPTWKMGKKITIDSATLFNKGLEMIEARWLFDIPMSQVDVVIHPESIIHSMVEFADHSIMAQMSCTDMCFPIQYAITYPDRLSSHLTPLDFGALGKLTFEMNDPIRFPALRLAREAGERGGTLPSVMNAANEIAVDQFLNGNGTFPKIWETVERVMQKHPVIDNPSLEDILKADSWARKEAADCYTF